MENFALLAILEARPGKEAEVEAFLQSARPLVLEETGTIRWYAFKMAPSTYGIFDTFADEAGRTAHVGGEVARALFAEADELFKNPPKIEKLDILTLK